MSSKCSHLVYKSPHLTALFEMNFRASHVATDAAKSLQSCPTLCDPIDSSLPGSPVPGILQARTVEWVAISFSKAWKWKVKVKSLSHVRLLTTPWAAAPQAPPSRGFSRQEYWSWVAIALSVPSGAMVKNPPANAGIIRDMALIPRLRRFPGGEEGNPLQYFCLEKSHGQRSLMGYNL